MIADWLYRLEMWLTKGSVESATVALSQFSEEEKITILMNSCSIGVISIAHDRKVERLRRGQDASS